MAKYYKTCTACHQMFLVVNRLSSIPDHESLASPYKCHGSSLPGKVLKPDFGA